MVHELSAAPGSESYLRGLMEKSTNNDYHKNQTVDYRPKETHQSFHDKNFPQSLLPPPPPPLTLPSSSERGERGVTAGGGGGAGVAAGQKPSSSKTFSSPPSPSPPRLVSSSSASPTKKSLGGSSPPELNNKQDQSTTKAPDSPELLLLRVKGESHDEISSCQFQSSFSPKPKEPGIPISSSSSSPPHKDTFKLEFSHKKNEHDRDNDDNNNNNSKSTGDHPRTLNSSLHNPTSSQQQQGQGEGQAQPHHRQPSLDEQGEKKAKKVDFNLSIQPMDPTTKETEFSQDIPPPPGTTEDNQQAVPGDNEKKHVESQLTFKKGTQSSGRRRSRSPSYGNIMREIRKMSLASQDALEEKKKASAASSAAAQGIVPASTASGGGVGGGGTGSPPGTSPSSKKIAAKRLKRRKRREEEYTDKDRAAAVTLGSRDIKQSLAKKRKRERKLHVSIQLLHSEDFLSAMFFVEAAYQMRIKKQTRAALTTLDKALELNPTHKGALVARSQCHLKLGDAASALKDAETSFDGNIMGLYQYAEALYNLGQFEKALIAYHRGFRIRKAEAFRIGIQKSQEAIRRAIGDRSATQIEDLDQILPLIELEALANRKEEQGSVRPATDESEILGRKLGTKLKASKTRARWVAREVLGQMYFDKSYLTQLLHRPDIQSDQGAAQELRFNATEALNYLEIREQFYRQQNPMYARKQGLNFNNKMVLQYEEQERERQEASRRLKMDAAESVALKNIPLTQHGKENDNNNKNSEASSSSSTKSMATLKKSFKSTATALAVVSTHSPPPPPSTTATINPPTVRVNSPMMMSVTGNDSLSQRKNTKMPKATK